MDIVAGPHRMELSLQASQALACVSDLGRPLISRTRCSKFLADGICLCVEKLALGFCHLFRCRNAIQRSLQRSVPLLELLELCHCSGRSTSWDTRGFTTNDPPGTTERVTAVSALATGPANCTLRSEGSAHPVSTDLLGSNAARRR